MCPFSIALCPSGRPQGATLRLSGNEIETQSGLIPIEIKAGATARPEMAREIAAFRRAFGDRATNSYVIHPGQAILPLGEGVLAWPLAAL